MSGRYRDSGPLDCKVYVGDLGNNGTKHELEEAFGYYGPLRNVWVARNPAGFAFVEFEDPRDARDAVRALDGRSLCGRRVRVEMSSGKSRHTQYRGPPSRPFNPEDRCYDCGERGHYARDCRKVSRRYRSRSRSHRSRTRSRSRGRSASRSLSRSRSRSPVAKASRSRSGSRERSVSRSRSGSRSRSNRGKKKEPSDRSASKSPVNDSSDK
ncbi:serine/arginine-rich splicing factor 3-like isoform X1 [Limulus polyphemus]|uniref:Serine/arginine-rich splicing factor 3-like isoform X1 n=2 Tax=Limulus polyphemus TaxID=6850 RepID=A0ABM1T3T0_LIMPO|nr:serine/arginine-rich splicing factor 3-like isoform X1 [Limulus polyphemus]XP_022250535.1 serine/arginine-rich splicing factor 3-like isoform X1 [Limulus polyphemus]XP_022250536.1 serine/arginine-rich splicing factor 3-like isoform X1 [Limulus polyphemus]XP_022250537.1 serine/arginine-rich splicing factor 3-like isoform X1 [Limulus polyphemus]